MISSIGSSTSSTELAALMAKQAAKMFKKVDTNEDGGIDKTEMQTMIDQMGGKGPSVDEIFARTDGNQDGKIDETENAKAMEARRAEMEQMRTDMQGRLQGPPPPPPTESSSASSEETDTLTELLKALQESDTTDAESIISQIADTLIKSLDSNNNKSIDKEDLVSRLKEMQQGLVYEQTGSTQSNSSLSGSLVDSIG